MLSATEQPTVIISYNLPFELRHTFCRDNQCAGGTVVDPSARVEMQLTGSFGCEIDLVQVEQ